MTKGGLGLDEKGSQRARVQLLGSELESLLKGFVAKYHVSPEELCGSLSSFAALSFQAVMGETHQPTPKAEPDFTGAASTFDLGFREEDEVLEWYRTHDIETYRVLKEMEKSRILTELLRLVGRLHIPAVEEFLRKHNITIADENGEVIAPKEGGS